MNFDIRKKCFLFLQILKMENTYFYVFVFTKTPDTMRAYEFARIRYSEHNVIIMPTPAQISKCCGLSISIRNFGIDEQISFLNSLDTNATLFELALSTDEKGTKPILSAAKVSETVKVGNDLF